MPVYRPSHHAVLTVPILGATAEKDAQNAGTQTIDVPIRVLESEFVRNNHLQADELKLTVEYLDLLIDPRFLKNATVQFWMGDAGTNKSFVPSDANFRFIGVLEEAERRTEEGGLCVDLRFKDYTTLFLAQKPFPSSGIPTYNSSIIDAWRRICDSTGWWSPDTGKIVSNVGALRDRLVAKGGVDLSRVIGEGIPKRLRDYGKVSIKTSDSAWDAWQRCIFSLGLISYIDKDQCIVTTSEQLLTEKNAPALVYGRNLLSARERINACFSNRGVGLLSYDVITGKTIEAFYPQPGDVRIKQKRQPARTKHKRPPAADADNYDYFEYNVGLSDVGILQEVARRAYEERSRQEIEGSVTTAHMVATLPDGTDLDLLNLGPGDCIQVTIDQGTSELLRNQGTPEEKLTELIAVGYDPSVARLLVANLDTLPFLNSTFLVRRVHAKLSDDDFVIEIDYCNRVTVLGDTEK